MEGFSLIAYMPNCLGAPSPCWPSQATTTRSTMSFHHSSSATNRAYVAANPANSSSSQLG